MYILSKRKLTPALADSLNGRVLKLLRDLIRNCVHEDGALYHEAKQDKDICKCRKRLNELSNAKSSRKFKDIVNQRGGIALPLGLLSLAIPSIIGLITGR